MAGLAVKGARYWGVGRGPSGLADINPPPTAIVDVATPGTDDICCPCGRGCIGGAVDGRKCETVGEGNPCARG